jgi:hypothetical protein
MDSLMNSIDKVSDAEYKDLCDKMQELESKHVVPVRIWFMKPVAWFKPVAWNYDEDVDKIVYEDCHAYYDLRPQQLIVMMTLQDFENHKKNIDTTSIRSSKYNIYSSTYVDMYSNTDIGSHEPDERHMVYVYCIELVNQN